VTVNMINERALAAVITSATTRKATPESRRGGECYDAGVRRLFELGYPPYRASGERDGAAVPGRDGRFVGTVRRLKESTRPGCDHRAGAI